jgi:hypothetical protein
MPQARPGLHATSASGQRELTFSALDAEMDALPSRLGSSTHRRRRGGDSEKRSVFSRRWRQTGGGGLLGLKPSAVVGARRHGHCRW